MTSFDPIDRKILKLVEADASLPVDAVSEQAGLSRNACWRRIKRLEAEGVIKARVALLDPAKLNLGLTVFIAVRTTRHDAAWLDAFKSAVRNIPEITGVYRLSGETDYLLRAVVPDMPAYDALYQRLIAKVALSDVSSSFVMEEIKDTHALPLDYV